MARFDEGPDSDAMLSSTFDEHINEPPALDASESPVGIGDDVRRGLAQNRQLDVRFGFVVCKALDVIRNPHDAMRIESPEVGLDEAAADDLRLAFRRTTGAQ